MHRYQHTYGGIATDVGTFHENEILQFFGELVPAVQTTAPDKVLDFLGEDREVLVYSTLKPSMYAVVCINRRIDNTARIQAEARSQWLLANPVPR